MLLRIDLPWAVFGIICDEMGAVTRAAPIAHYTVGWTREQVVDYFIGRGAKVQVFQ